MRNPWKTSTFALLALVLALLGREVASADVYDADPKPLLEKALGHLKEAAKLLREVDGERPPAKTSNEDTKTSARARALDLTNAAIVQVAATLKTKK